METKGYIHSIETMGTLDGPGTRCVVFLQGCPLRCSYCHNPDTWQPKANIVMTAAELMNKILRYKSYFGNKGGITLSGGEPLFQSEFATEVFEICKKENIHTALDTAGSIMSESVKVLLRKTDLVLLDIKHTNPEKFELLTGGSLKNSLGFLEYITEQNIDLWVRQVIVPGFNDNAEEIGELAELLKDKPNLKRIELLAYHEMGKSKWEELGIDYKLKDIVPPSQEDINLLRNILAQKGLPIKFPKF